MTRAEPTSLVRPGLRERNKAAKLARIVAAARELFAAKGYAETTGREICQRADIGTGTLFLYVREKRELLFLVFEEDSRRLFREGRAAADRAPNLPDALWAMFGRFFRYYAADVALAREILRELLFRRHEVDGLGQLTREYAAHVAALVEAAQERGELRADVKPAEIAASFFAHYVQGVMGWLGAELTTRAQAERGVRRAIQLQIEGLAPASRRRKR